MYINLLLFMFLLLVTTSCITTPEGIVAEAPKKEFDVLCHYMAWFGHSRNDGLLTFDHWEWKGNGKKHNPLDRAYGDMRDISSVYYPRIGVYDSADPDVIKYHILSAKSAGIDGFVVDWYGPGTSVDKTLQLIFRIAGESDFRIAVCYEEKICFPEWSQFDSRDSAVEKAKNDLKYLSETYLVKKNYWMKNGKPGIFVNSWGNWPGRGKKSFTSEEWLEIEAAAGTDCYIIRQNYDRDYPSIGAGFGWVGDRDYVDWFHKTGDQLIDDDMVDFYCSSANPGFDDRGVWGWGNGPRFEPRMGFSNYDRYWKSFAQSKSDCIQIVTWNDFEEGTVIEPTVQFGSQYLDRTEEWITSLKGTSRSIEDNELPYSWFVLRKFAPKEYTGRINLAGALLSQRDSRKAANVLDEVVAESGIRIPPYIGMGSEYEAMERVSEKGRQIVDQIPLFSAAQNLAVSVEISSSSDESADRAAGNANDGLVDTRWASEHTDNQHLTLGFGETTGVKKIVIFWEDAHAEEFSIQLSQDGDSWTDSAAERDFKGGISSHILSPKQYCRYLRINCIKRATVWGFSIRELAVFDDDLSPEQVRSR